MFLPAFSRSLRPKTLMVYNWGTVFPLPTKLWTWIALLIVHILFANTACRLVICWWEHYTQFSLNERRLCVGCDAVCLLTCSSDDFHAWRCDSQCGQSLCVIGNERVCANDVCYFYGDLRVGRRRMPFSVICTTATFFLSRGTALAYCLRLISTIFVMIQQQLSCQQ